MHVAAMSLLRSVKPANGSFSTLSSLTGLVAVKEKNIVDCSGLEASQDLESLLSCGLSM
jgi:hypothetical protein